MLSKYDLLVLDPFQPGVVTTISDPPVELSPHVVARLDLYNIIGSGSVDNDDSLKRAVEQILLALTRIFHGSKAGRVPFTGICLAGWHSHVSVALIHALAENLTNNGLGVYLEAVPPHFLEGGEKPNLSLFAGVVVKNGTTLPNGEVRDYFQMENMRSTTRGFVAESCLRPFVVMMWDTIDPDIEISHAVVKRGYGWCGYHGAMLWIGSDASITNPAAHHPIEEPLAAFQWLKEQRIMTAHEAYRQSRHVSIENCHLYIAKDFNLTFSTSSPTRKCLKTCWGPLNQFSRTLEF